MEPADRYITYDNLPPISKNITETVTNLFSPSWQSNFEAVTELRSFLKFNFTEFQHYWTYLRPRIQSLSQSIRSSISKNSLLLLQELLSQPREGMTPTDLLECLLAKSASEKSFLKSEILTAVQNLCRNFLNIDILTVIISQSHSKSSEIAKISLKLLEEHIDKVPLLSKFKVLILLEEGKRQEHQMIAKKLLVELELTWDEFSKNFDLLTERQKKWIKSLQAAKSNKKVNLKEVIKLKKEGKENKLEVIE